MQTKSMLCLSGTDHLPLWDNRSSGQMLCAEPAESFSEARPCTGEGRSAGATWILLFVFLSLKIGPSLECGMASSENYTFQVTVL